LRIPASLGENCKNLIVQLLNRNPSRRLGGGPDGANEIKRHPFFDGLDWNLLSERKIPAPKSTVEISPISV